jgi:hypothetical protein
MNLTTPNATKEVFTIKEGVEYKCVIRDQNVTFSQSLISVTIKFKVNHSIISVRY